MVAVVAVPVAVKITTATTSNAHSARLSVLSVAVVAVLSNSQQNFKNVCKEELKNTKIMRSVNINTLSTATSATKKPTNLDTPRFYSVAVPKSSATSTATTATKNINPKGGKGKIIRNSSSEKYTTTIILGGI